MNYCVLFNHKSRKYEIYKTRDIEKLRASKAKEYQDEIENKEEVEDEEEEINGEQDENGEGGEVKKSKYYKQKGVFKLDLYQYDELKEIKEKG